MATGEDNVTGKRGKPGTMKTQLGRTEPSGLRRFWK